MGNIFLTKCQGRDTRTENGALSNSSTGSILCDQMGLSGNYMGRPYEEVAVDQNALWEENSLYAMRFPFYLRMITRKVKLADNESTNSVQKGQGLRDESFKRLLWIAKTHKHEFEENIWLLPCVGRWKDIWDLMRYDIELHTRAIDHKVMFQLLEAGLALKQHENLVKKYMPRIRSNKKCTTFEARTNNMIAKEFAKWLGLSHDEYRHLKTMDSWQQKMCARKFDEIAFSEIPGKALSNLVAANFFVKHKLADKYALWLDKQNTVNCNGYVYELAEKWENGMRSDFMRETFDKQFKKLVETAKDGKKMNEKVFVALDTSGSMDAKTQAGVSALAVAKSLGVFFSTMIDGSFHKHVIMFDSTSTVKKLNGEFCDMIDQIPSDAMGSTNFMSVCKTIVDIRKNNPNIPLEDYPTTLLVVSDMQFNPTVEYWDRENWGWVKETSNYEDFKAKLLEAFPKEFVDNFKFIWWNCTSRNKDFPAQMDDGGCYMFSGFDGSIVSMILGESTTIDENGNKRTLSMEEMAQKALSQEIFSFITL